MKIRKVIEFILVLAVLSCSGAVAQGATTPHSQSDAIGLTPPRLSLATGEVSFWRPGSQEWSQAQVNTPLAPGDLLYTGGDGNLEIQIGPRAFVRGSPNTQLGLENNEPDFLQFKVSAGNVSFDLYMVELGRTVEVDTPHGVFTIEQGGYYRVAIDGERTSFTTRRGGQATMTHLGGETVALGPNKEVIIEGIESPRVASYTAPELDEWDRWNYARTDHLLDAVSARYVSAGVYGVEDLDRYGTWRIVPTYGAVWIPRGMPSRWAPYSTGAWVRDPHYGWTWVDTAPWGWAPYHYGRWVFVSGFWAWAPGPMVVRPAYAPALVAFFGGSSASVSVSFGLGPVLSWVSLGWGEPCLPWWGPAHFRHRPWWGGWGGPRVVNNVIINKTTVVKVQGINAYRNVSVRNAVVVVKEKHFGRGPVASAHFRQADAKNLKPIPTGPQVRATPASFAPTGKRGISPPKKVLERPVVATRAPKARAELLSGKKRDVASARVPTPKPRIVSAPQRRATAPLPKRPPYGQSEVGRRMTDRARSSALPETITPKVRQKTSEPVPPHQAQRQREPQVFGSSPVKPQPSKSQAEVGQGRQPAPRKTEGRLTREQESGGASSATYQASQQRQRQVQAVRPSPPVKTRSSRLQADVSRPRQPAFGKTIPRQVGTQAWQGSSSVRSQNAKQRQRKSHVTGPSPSSPKSSVHQGKLKAPSAPVQPGKPANRLLPNRAERGLQERERALQGQVHMQQRSKPQSRRFLGAGIKK
jgi:hypothetical protein